MLGRNEDKERKTCWQLGMTQPLTMASGSFINLMGGVASLWLSSTEDKVNPLPFIATAMFTSSLYVIGNTYRAYQIYKESTFVEREEERRENKEAKDVIINIRDGR